MFSSHQVFGIMTKAAMVHHLIPKKAYVDGPLFLENLCSRFVPEYYWESLTKPKIPRRLLQLVISEHYGHA